MVPAAAAMRSVACVKRPLPAGFSGRPSAARYSKLACFGLRANRISHKDAKQGMVCVVSFRRFFFSYRTRSVYALPWLASFKRGIANFQGTSLSIRLWTCL